MVVAINVKLFCYAAWKRKKTCIFLYYRFPCKIRVLATDNNSRSSGIVGVFSVRTAALNFVNKFSVES